GGRDVCAVHFPQVWPIDPAAARRHLQGRTVHAVEGNATAQFADLLRAAGALEDFRPLLRYDGLPPVGEEIAGRVAG
ncbi:MAG: 2-oxoacid:acceptor oxidoreductase subunit alpha, partial [Planctomycetota bacterium]